MLLRKISAAGQRSQNALARLMQYLPCPCALCGATAPQVLCQACMTQFFGAPQRRCSQCATSLPQTNHGASHVAERCGDCLKLTPAFDATLVASDYAAPIDQLVLGLKFGGRLALAPLFAAMLRDTVLQAGQHRPALPTMLAPVPLGPQRLAERGFNQALEIARPLSRALGIALYPDLAIRLRETRAQAMLAPEQRRNNVRNGFTVAPYLMERIRGQHIGVVDDVITTGETLNELAATLKRFGASRVTNLVFARTPPH